MSNKTHTQRIARKAAKRAAKRKELYLKSLNISATTKAQQLREKALMVIANNPVLKAKYVEYQAKMEEMKGIESTPIEG